MIEQIAIAVTGMTAIILTNDPRSHVRRWAPVLGLCAQPFWFWTTWHAHQWGIFAMSFVYTASWARGFYHAWIAE